MSDYPDYTELMQIIGSDIMVPMDIQGAYIMMPVDIQAQYITLDIDIVAQTVGYIGIDIKAQTIDKLDINLAASAITLDINLKTSAITLNVDITAQTVGNINFDIKAQSVGMYLQPDWQVKEGTDKNLFATASVDTGTTTKILDYPVSAGKTFYIWQWGFNIAYEGGMSSQLYYTHNATDTRLAASGGYQGGAVAFSKPIAIIAGDKIRVEVLHGAGESRTCKAHVGGYEI